MRLAAGLTQAVKAEANRLGFALVGVTTPDQPPHFDVYERWLYAGRHGEMAYLASERARQRRQDPRRILPECKSILVLGIRYPSPTLAEVTAGSAELPRGQVAAYAWGADYHDVLPERLEALAAFIERQVGGAVPHRAYTDTGPILERDLAQRAGLGWIGKNTCLIHPRLGSYFFLAEVLLGVELEPDAPFQTDHCGACTRCLDACPTGCILPDRTLDARRCIAYLTIELKGAIPYELRPQMGNWVFGCDVCQQVCPWNVRFAAPDGNPAFAPRPDLPRPNLLDEARLSDEDFRRKFKGSPLKRAKRRGYLRNAAVALGNSRSADALTVLVRLLNDDTEPLARLHAAWALGQVGSAEARQALEVARLVETDGQVRQEIELALQAFP
jgi:epoxyqueuosine reductase